MSEDLIPAPESFDLKQTQRDVALKGERGKMSEDNREGL